jgi:hypothetical protein
MSDVDWQERRRQQRVWQRIPRAEKHAILSALVGTPRPVRVASPRRQRKFARRGAAAAERIRRDRGWRGCHCARPDPGQAGRCDRCCGELAP